MGKEGCVFCRIISGETPAEIVYQDDEITAFMDHRPAAPVHILLVTNRHMDSLNDAAPEDAALIGRLVIKARELAAEQGIERSGYRLFINIGPDGGQSIYHLHLHLMGGRKLPIFHF